MAKWAHNLTFKKRDGQTNKRDTQTQRFWPPRRRVKSEPHQTWYGDREPRARSCTSKTFGGLMHSFATRGRQFWEPYTLTVAPMGVKLGTSFGPLLRAKFHPHRCNVSLLRGEKPQNRPL